MTILLLSVALLILITLDVGFYIITPKEHRRRWWALLPGGGIAVYVVWRKQA